MNAHDLLDTDDLAALLGVRPSSLRAMRSQPHRHRRIDGLPAPLRLISGRPVWLRTDIEQWLADRRQSAATAAVPAASDHAT